ncbi:hypothetical protein ACFLTO_01565 [Chloroflexota bacterium]
MERKKKKNLTLDMSLIFTYKKTLQLVKYTKNLVEHSSHLTWLTVWLALTASAMTGVAIIQLVAALL